MPQFVIIARDAQDPDALMRRMRARSDHLARYHDGIREKTALIGGAILNEHGDMCGSVMIVEFPNREALDEWLESDPYVLEGVWDNIEVLAFRQAGQV